MFSMTLTEVAHWAKKFGLIIAVVLFVLILVIYLALRPKEDDGVPSAEQATLSCTGDIESFVDEKLEIPSLEMGPGSTQEFKVDTPTGKIDKFPRIVNVYRYNNPGETLTFLSEAQIIAQKLGFNKEKYIREGTVAYIWDDLATARRLRIEARNMLFELKTEFGNMMAFPQDVTQLPTDENAKKIATDFLKSTGLFTTDYASGQVSSTLIKVNADGSLSQVSSKSEADLIRVDFFRKAAIVSILENSASLKNVEKSMENFDYESFEVDQNGQKVSFRTYFVNIEQLNSFSNKSYLSVYVGPTDKRKSGYNSANIYGVEYKNWIVELAPCGTYPIIPAGTAVNLVTQGEGSLVYFNKKGGDDVKPYTQLTATDLTILDIDLAYYDLHVEGKFLQPIYIVKGEAVLDSGDVGSFVYYVPAIDYDQL